MPRATFDMGALQISPSEVIIFGGFDQGAKQDAFLYSTSPGDGDFREAKGLETGDFFEQNGVYIRLAGDESKLIFNGHSHNHLFDCATKEFKTLSME